MSLAGSIIGIPGLEVERVDRRETIEVWAKPRFRPACHYCQSRHLRIKATHQRTIRHTRQGNRVMFVHLRVPKYHCTECGRYFRHRFVGVRPRFRASESYRLEVFEAHDGGVTQRKRPVFTAFFQAALENDLGCFTVRNKATGVVLGSTRFYSHDASVEAVRLGYTFLCPRYWGTGANQEMKEVLLEYAFTIVQKVYFDIGKDNFRSRKAVEKLGAVECVSGDEKIVYLLNKEAFSDRAWGLRGADQS